VLKRYYLGLLKRYVSSLASSEKTVKVMRMKFPNKQNKEGQKTKSKAQCSPKIKMNLIGCQTSHLCQCKSYGGTQCHLLPPEESRISSDVIAQKNTRATTERKDGV
jgi:hypothetical protein